MHVRAYPIDKEAEYRRASATDLIELLPAPGIEPLFIEKWALEGVVVGLASGRDFIHLSGPTGTAKTTLVEVLEAEPRNFEAVLRARGLPVKPLRVLPVPMVTFESPSELYRRRAIQNGSTYDEDSLLVQSLRVAATQREEAYPAIFLKELGRVHSASIQGALLELMNNREVVLGDGTSMDTQGISWISDSNYAAAGVQQFELVKIDHALARRFTRNITLDYLDAEQEEMILRALGPSVPPREGADGEQEDPVRKVVELGQRVRNAQNDGRLQSLAPATLYGYRSFLRCVECQSDLSLEQAAMMTLLGNVDLSERREAHQLLREVFGLGVADGDDPFESGLNVI